MSEIDVFADALSHDPVKIKYRTLAAREILSGQVKLPSTYGSGMLNELIVKEGPVLSANIRVSFEPYKSTLFFHIRDRLLVEGVQEIIRHKYDSLTSDGLCIKPIYSRPKGYISESGSSDNLLYTFELGALLSGKVASLPYYLYVNKADGTKLPSAVPILAHRVSIHVYKDVYLQFKPNNISVSEVLDICKIKYEEYKPILHNVYWGIDNRKSVQPFSGKATRDLHCIRFELSDLLSDRAYLPAERISGKYYLTEPVDIRVSGTSHKFDKGIPMTTLWNKWRPHSADTLCVCDKEYTNLCIFKASRLFSNKGTLPSLKGLVTSKKVVIEFAEDSVLCYDRNHLIQDILWTVHRLYKGNRPQKYDYTFIHRNTRRRVKPTRIYKSIFALMEDFKDLVTENCLILVDPSCMPMPIPSGTNVAEAEVVYNKVVGQLHAKRNAAMSMYRIWKNGEEQ